MTTPFSVLAYVTASTIYSDLNRVFRRLWQNWYEDLV